ncbi:MAG: hypothetical protein SCALA701_24610 [Candidatus Scalindua sp.]|nr:hypothetical protein [Planctomycetota bacterium]RZV83981.1 MAG: hypothetical protein EX341_08580 [Candidatus Scalindua sp. SCAELEC01]GJQ59660.1 MAG: hypothetical protein SCALA701_24610 [Candidatus Scalindua sp.]
MESFDLGEIDAYTCFNVNKQSLTDEIEDIEFLAFAIRNLSELFACIASGRTNIRICMDSAGKILFLVG